MTLDEFNEKTDRLVGGLFHAFLNMICFMGMVFFFVAFLILTVSIAMAFVQTMP